MWVADVEMSSSCFTKCIWEKAVCRRVLKCGDWSRISTSSASSVYVTPVATFQHPPIHSLFSYTLCKAWWCYLNIRYSHYYLSFLHSWFRASLHLFQNKHQQDYTYGLSFISRLVVLYSICFELLGAHHQEFTLSTLCRQSLAYCIIFCCIPPVLLRVGNRTRRRTDGIQQKIIQYARDCLYSVEKVNSWWWAPRSSKHVE